MSTGKPPKPLTDFGPLFLPEERIPAAKPVEESSESLWAAFNDLAAGKPERFEATEPASMDMLKVARSHQYAETARMELAEFQAMAPADEGVTLESVLLEARRTNRVCPEPAQWLVFFEMIRAGSPAADQLRPPVPSPAWAITTDMAKRACFREQLEWADRNGRLADAFAFIQAMSREHWHYVGE